MARKLETEHDEGSRVVRNEESDDGSGKLLLNRRKYVKLGAVAATLLGTSSLGGASTADSGGATYRTDFSGGKL